MRAIVVRQGTAGVSVEDAPEPEAAGGRMLVETMAIGICGTDVEITRGKYGWAPPGRDRWILGHESIGRVAEDARDAGFARGDLVVGIVRRPDPVPCSSCAVGEWDMCRNGQYTERGIKERDGYCSEQFRVESDFAVRVPRSLGLLGVLTEPASVLAKAWDHIERIGRRAHWAPRRVLVTGAGPIGLIAAMIGRQRGLEVDVLDRHTTGPKPKLVAELGATYHTGSVEGL